MNTINAKIYNSKIAEKAIEIYKEKPGADLYSFLMTCKKIHLSMSQVRIRLAYMAIRILNTMTPLNHATYISEDVIAGVLQEAEIYYS